MPLPDHLFQFAAQPDALEHLQMGFENRAVLLAQFHSDGVAVLGDLRGRGGDGFIEPFQLVDHGVARDEAAGDAKSLVVHHQRFTYGNARRNGNPL